MAVEGLCGTAGSRGGLGPGPSLGAAEPGSPVRSRVAGFGVPQRAAKTELAFCGNSLILAFSNLDNQFRMSILERLEQMERRMAEMTGSQQHKQGGGGGSNGSGNGGTQAQV